MAENKMYFTQLEILWKIFSESPGATARIYGSDAYPDIKGVAQLYQVPQGVLIVTEVMNLPKGEEVCKRGVFGLHIHEGTQCTGNAQDPFADARTHFNPDNCGHPYHAGDMPPLFENEGYALTVFVTNRFKLEDIIGKTIIVHSKRDDFTSQPSGDAGEKIACGVIEPITITPRNSTSL